MAYAKVNSNTLVQYPYTREDLYREYTTIKRAPIIPASQLPEGIVVVLGETPSSYDPAAQHLTYSDTPTLVGGKWVLAATVTDKTEAEVTAETAAIEAGVRTQRDNLLKETDWWAVQDRTMSAEETAYRQALRDLPSQAGFPDVTWPTKPGE